MDISLITAHLMPALVIFLAALMQAITGFGLVIIAAPLLMIFYDPKLTVLIMFVVAMCTNIVQLPFVFREARTRVVAVIIIGYMLAQPSGMLIYHHFSSNQLKILVGSVIFLSLLAMQFSHHHFRQCHRNDILTGFLSGLSGVTTGMAGPPLIMYFAYADFTPQQLRGTSVFFFFLSGIISISFFAANGIDFTNAVYESAYMIPALVLGILLGQKLLKYVSPQLFRRLIFCMLYFVCLYTFYSVLAG